MRSFSSVVLVEVAIAKETDSLRRRFDLFVAVKMRICMLMRTSSLTLEYMAHSSDVATSPSTAVREAVLRIANGGGGSAGSAGNSWAGIVVC